MASPRVEVPAQVEDGWVQRRRRVSALIERTALMLFADRGYSNVTLLDVAAAAGVSPRTLTRYFPVKEDLLLSQPRRSAAVALSALAAAPSGDQAVTGLWHMWIGMTAAADPDELGLLRLWYRAVQTAPQALARGGAEMSELIRESLTSVAAQALDVRPDNLQARVLAAALTAAQETVFQRWLESDGAENLEELFMAAYEGLRRGLSSPTPAGTARLPAKS